MAISWKGRLHFLFSLGSSSTSAPATYAVKCGIDFRSRNTSAARSWRAMLSRNATTKKTTEDDIVMIRRTFLSCVVTFFE